MKLLYIANVRLPTEKAHGLAIMKMCEAFAKQGIEVEFLVPKRKNRISEDPFEYYGVEKNFKITRLFCLDLIPWLGKLGFLIEALTFAESAFWYGLFSKADVIYGRDELSLTHLSLFKKNVVWESHIAKKKLLVLGLLKKSKALVVISKGLKDYYMSLGVLEGKILVAPSGVDIEVFEKIKESKEELRKRLNLPLNKKLVAYVGKLHTMGEDKGVGKIESAMKEVEKTYPQAKFLVVSEARPGDVPAYMKAVDMLIMNYPNTEHYTKYMSSLKVFEYMASGTPIVTSDVPAIRDVLPESGNYFFKPDDSRSLIQMVNYALDCDTVNYGNIKKAKEFSWENRARKVINFFDL